MQKVVDASSDSGEIDLRELVRVLWRKRLMIIIITLICTVAAGLFAFMIKPAFEAKAMVIPPMTNDIAGFNFGRTTDGSLKPFSVRDVYNVFVRNLQSESLRREVFNAYYLPRLSEAQRSLSQDALYDDFSKRLKIIPIADKFSVVMRDDNADRSVELVDKLIASASEFARKEMKKNIDSEATILSENLNQQILFQREVALTERQDAIVKLREALRVAKAIGLEQPPVTTGNPMVEVPRNFVTQVIYMQGTKAIQAEIDNLESRVTDDPFIKDLRPLQIRYNYYKSIESSSVNGEVYKLDGIVEVADSPVRKKKTLIILLGLGFGLMFGAVFAVYFSRFNKSGLRTS